jgi:hypothetical protein
MRRMASTPKDSCHNAVVVQFEMRLVSGYGFSRTEAKLTETGFSPCARGVSKKLSYVRDRIVRVYRHA